jgi:hypothetical protein
MYRVCRHVCRCLLLTHLVQLQWVTGTGRQMVACVAYVITVTAASFVLPSRGMAEARFRPTGTTMDFSPIHFSCQCQSIVFRAHTD